MNLKRHAFKDRQVFIVRHQDLSGPEEAAEANFSVTELEHVNAKETFHYANMEKAFEKIRLILSSIYSSSRH